jgi:hypothetical protein
MGARSLIIEGVVSGNQKGVFPILRKGGQQWDWNFFYYWGSLCVNVICL